MKFWTGIGSRKTPPDVCALMTRLARWLAGQGWWLRSGHATGADWAFEQGAPGESTIYLPWDSFGQQPYGTDPGRPLLGHSVCDQNLWLVQEQELVALGLRPASTVRSHRLLHGRNVSQVLGHDYPGYSQPSKFVVCWCPEADGTPQGGTASAVLLAQHHKIQVFNLWRDEDRRRVEEKL